MGGTVLLTYVYITRKRRNGRADESARNDNSQQSRHSFLPKLLHIEPRQFYEHLGRQLTRPRLSVMTVLRRAVFHIAGQGPPSIEHDPLGHHPPPMAFVLLGLHPACDSLAAASTKIA
jgi:hypothetical protein